MVRTLDTFRWLRFPAAKDGAIDRGRVDAASTVTTDSAVFRAYTRAEFEPSYSIRFDARVGPPARASGRPGTAST